MWATKKKMSFVSFWKNTKNGICLFLEKNSKLNVFEKQVNLDLTLFGKKQKMSFVSFWNEPNVAAALMSTHFASVPDGRVRTVSKGECCGRPMLVTTTVGQSAPASSFLFHLFHPNACPLDLGLTSCFGLILRFVFFSWGSSSLGWRKHVHVTSLEWTV